MVSYASFNLIVCIAPPNQKDTPPLYSQSPPAMAEKTLSCERSSILNKSSVARPGIQMTFLPFVQYYSHCFPCLRLNNWTERVHLPIKGKKNLNTSPLEERHCGGNAEGRAGSRALSPCRFSSIKYCTVIPAQQMLLIICCHKLTICTSAPQNILIYMDQPK